MFDRPISQHEWLSRLTGDWLSTSDCVMNPGDQPQTTSARMHCRMLGGLWLLAESKGETPEGEEWSSLMTVGFDTKKGRFVGTFAASMMSYLWPYEGDLDAEGKKLPLNSVGPKFDGTGQTQYRDTIEIVSDDEWLFYGDVLGDDGQWHRLMSSVNRRVAS
jgi:hypothetical protein